MKFLISISFLFISFNLVYCLRVISLAPSITEMIYFIGAGNDLIADTVSCNYPEKAKKLPKIGNFSDIDIEKIVYLKPDLVIASFSGNSREQIERLLSLGVRVITLKENSVRDIIANLKYLGQLLNRDVKDKIGKLVNELQNVKKPSHMKRALIFISVYPIFSVSDASFLGDVLHQAGFINAVKSEVKYPVIDEEDLSKLKPDIIFISFRYRNEQNFLKAMFKRLHINPLIVFVNEDLMSRPGPRIFDFISEISRYALD